MEEALAGSRGKPPVPPGLLRDIRQLIEDTRSAVAVTVNAGLTLLYWHIGRRINDEVLKGDRAEYGKQIIATLSQELACEYGTGFGAKNLHHMTKFASVFSDIDIVSTLCRQLSWSHFKQVIYLEKPLQRDFYVEMARLERWSVRTLREKISSMLYERTAISKKPDELARKELSELRDKNTLSPNLVFRDPYVLDFLDLKDTFSEHDLESAILREIERFLLELGSGFSFVARQKRMTIDNEDHYLDMLFFHRKLQRLVAIELKLGKFKSSYKGQMELYLRWLEKHEKEAWEGEPLGLILCAEGSPEQIELLQLGESGIRVAEYLTELPSKDVLRENLLAAITTARELLEHRQGNGVYEWDEGGSQNGGQGCDGRGG